MAEDEASSTQDTVDSLCRAVSSSDVLMVLYWMSLLPLEWLEVGGAFAPPVRSLPPASSP